MSNEPIHEPGTDWIGSDKIYRGKERLIIHAAEEMDWPIREFCRAPIFFRGEKYYVRSRWKGDPPFAMVYELWPWPADLHESSSQTVVYDSTYVAERDWVAVRSRRRDRFHLFLLPFYPLLGLCWGKFKNGLLADCGFEPGSITKASIFLVFNLFVLQAIFVGWLGGGVLSHLLGISTIVNLDWIMMLAFGADAVIRFSQSLKWDVEQHWGFCEWLLPRAHRGS